MTDIITQLADMVEDQFDTNHVFALRLDTCTPAQRALLITRHGQTLEELRRRGHHGIGGGVVHVRHDDEHAFDDGAQAGEYLVIGYPPDETDDAA